MNYTNNVRCDQIKPLERKLFRYLCRQIDYASGKYIIQDVNSKLIYFKEKYSVGQRMIDYYIQKWNALQICHYENIGKYYYRFRFTPLIIDEPLNSIYFSKSRNEFDRILEYKVMIPVRCVRLITQKINNERSNNNDIG